MYHLPFQMFCLLLSSLSVIVYVYWSVSLYNLFREMLTKLDDDVYSAGTLVYRNQVWYLPKAMKYSFRILCLERGISIHLIRTPKLNWVNGLTGT